MIPARSFASKSGQAVQALILTAVAVAIWCYVIWGPLDRLGAARSNLADLHALATAPNPGVPALIDPAMDIDAATAAEAAAMLRAALSQRATGQGLLVEDLHTLSAPGRDAVAVTLRLSGPEDSMLSYLRAVEAGRPLVRFRRWVLAPAGTAGIVRFDGEAVALWRPQ